jgi:hypothetical protein
MQKSKILPIPNDGGNLQIKKKDQLTIRVSQTCQWCYKDPNNCFPKFLAPGQVGPGDHGPYTAENEGQVVYDCPKAPPCVPKLSAKTAHTITVSTR